MKRSLFCSVVFCCAAWVFRAGPVIGGEGTTPTPGSGGKDGRAGVAEHIVVIVCDGLRPDSVTEKNMPVLYKLSREGVTFAHSHSVYPSSTEVNGAALATGVFPAVSGIAANREYRPAINPRRAIPTESREATRGGDRLTGGKYLGAATIAETVQAAGFPTAVAGTKNVVVLHDRSEKRDSRAASQSCVIAAGEALPSEMDAAIVKAQGAFPPIAFPNTAQDVWTTKSLIQFGWKGTVPKFSLLWLSDPDFSQHHTAPGSEEALAALKGSDENIGAVLAALDSKGVREKTDLVVVSDHGFSTLVDPPDLTEELLKAGFNAGVDLLGPAKPGRILVVGLGGSTAFYVVDHDRAVTARLVEFLQRAKYSGAILTREKMDGTFPLDELRMNTAHAPDVLMSFTWNAAPNAFGVPGLLLGGTGNNTGRGMHASLSRFDLHNTLIAAGPDFKRGWVDEFPAGNIDVAPTVLSLLGIAPADSPQGRVLVEALTGGVESDVPKPERETVKASCQLRSASWSQYLDLVRVGQTVYFEEANGALTETGK